MGEAEIRFTLGSKFGQREASEAVREVKQVILDSLDGVKACHHLAVFSYPDRAAQIWA